MGILRGKGTVQRHENPDGGILLQRHTRIGRDELLRTERNPCAAGPFGGRIRQHADVRGPEPEQRQPEQRKDRQFAVQQPESGSARGDAAVADYHPYFFHLPRHRGGTAEMSCHDAEHRIVIAHGSGKQKRCPRLRLQNQEWRKPCHMT